MDKQKLPLQVLRDLEGISGIVKESKIKLDVESNENALLILKSQKYPNFYFHILNFRFDNGEMIYALNYFPANENSEVANFEVKSSIKKYLERWLSVLKGYDSIDVKAIFQLEYEENFRQPEDDIFEDEEKILPYCLKGLSVANFQGIKHATIENLPVDTQWVFLVGENGFGKSTVLQSIMLGLHGSKDGSYELIQNREIRIQVEYKSDKENFINDCWRNPYPLTHLAAYGPSRLNLQADATLSDEARKSSVTYGLFNSDGALLNIEAKLKDWLLQKDKKRFELVKKAFLKLIPHLADMRLNESTSQIEYLEKDIIDGTDTYEPLPYQKLASGFRAIIGLAGDMIVRLSNAQPTIKDPAQLKGIVIIDELDLHWHPKLQKQIPQLFSSVFPKVQFIVSTHSPIPLLGAPHNSVVLKVTRTKEEGVKIERVDVDLKYLTPNLILTSGVFDMDDVLSVENDDLTKTRTEDTFEEMKHNDEVEDYLAEFEKSNRQFPDELFESKAN